MKTKLSKENREKINPRGLYKHKVEKQWLPSYYDDVYWCHNWTFYPHFFDDGRVFMYDSYYDDWDSAKEVTDDNFEEWEFIFDIDKVSRISYESSLEYDEQDLYKNIANNSGGYSCYSNIWVNKSAKKNIDKQIKQAEYRLNEAKSTVEWRQRDLDRLIQEKDKLKKEENNE